MRFAATIEFGINRVCVVSKLVIPSEARNPCLGRKCSGKIGILRETRNDKSILWQL